MKQRAVGCKVRNLSVLRPRTGENVVTCGCPCCQADDCQYSDIGKALWFPRRPGPRCALVKGGVRSCSDVAARRAYEEGGERSYTQGRNSIMIELYRTTELIELSELSIMLRSNSKGLESICQYGSPSVGPDYGTVVKKLQCNMTIRGPIFNC